MKILVTGGAGFIGSHVVDAYINAGHEVVVIDNLSTGSKKNLNLKAKFYEVDICDAKKIAEIFAIEKPEVVNHHAAQVSVTVSQRDPALTTAVNFQGTVNLLNAFSSSECASNHDEDKDICEKRFIFASTGGAMYSTPKKWPANEDEVPNPLSVYGISKLSAEKAVRESAEKNGFSYCILRYSNVFGPRQNSHGESGVVAVFSDFAKVKKVPTIYRKESTRDYVFVGDVASANLLALKKGQGIYNIATGVETTNEQVFKTISDIFGWHVVPVYTDARPGELFRSVLDATKAKNELGWDWATDFTLGVKKIAEYES
jgi:UDP-glucose 4-epimerase